MILKAFNLTLTGIYTTIYHAWFFLRYAVVYSPLCTHTFAYGIVWYIALLLQGQCGSMWYAGLKCPCPCVGSCSKWTGEGGALGPGPVVWGSGASGPGLVV